jgi:hypothetical protein
MTDDPTIDSGLPTRTLRPLRPRPARAGLGSSAAGAVAASGDLGVSLTRRRGSTGVLGEATLPTPSLPWGVWPAGGEAELPRSVLGDALASYAAMLRARRVRPSAPPPRGIPLVARRQGATRHGAHAGPGGLARSLVPVDEPVPTSPMDALRAPRPAPAPRREA